MSELKPCPFCGGDACLERDSKGRWAVSCIECPAELGVACELGGVDEIEEDFYFGEREDAVKTWNTRKSGD